MIDRTARLSGILGSALMTKRARRICKSQASRRSRAAARMEILQSESDHYDTDVTEPEDYSTWTVLSPMSGKFHTRIYIIEANTDLATRVYAARNSGRHPEKVSCDCGCGADYSMDEVCGTLSEATAWLRYCDWRGHRYVEGRKLQSPDKWQYHTLEQFLARQDVTLIRAEDICDAEAIFPTPRVTSPSMYSEDAKTIAWLLDLEM